VLQDQGQDGLHRQRSTCAAIATFPKKTDPGQPADQFGLEGPLPVLAPKLFCTPVDKQVVGGPRPPRRNTRRPPRRPSPQPPAPPPRHPVLSQRHGVGDWLQRALPALSSGRVAVHEAPLREMRLRRAAVCCECPGVPCFNTNGQCPTTTNASPFETPPANASGHCDCGFCSDGACTGTPCSTSQPCPTGQFCDPITVRRRATPALRAGPAPRYRASGPTARTLSAG